MAIEAPSVEEVLASQAGAGFMQQHGFGDSVTLVNRTKGPLNVKFNGRDYPIQPGATHGFPREMVKYAREQNPVMGTQDLFKASRYKSLVGVANTKDDCSPIEQSKAVERVDRKTAKGKGRHAKPIEGEEIRASEARIGGEDDEEGDGFIDNAAVGAR